ncbi:hypothetical protein B6N60_03407 [Richelia sinica FACHB-800]|uniref:Uncharacterized protein n=1 Tax=Richelia sinica FACHB-800 TaxID=1357546 RepID=A0A975T9Q1_9NOST|nr:hypothetical protein [Richelia sinica]MBD2663513.1 hypothetical protein [Richelia sinica FACHB-800]QXE24700.1 hypothetical protein B6N60_03407 [Richelia sinica FACHB-800]
MKSLSPFSYQLKTSLLFSLALTSLLTCGLVISSNKIATAIPRSEPIELSQNNLPKNIANAVLRDASKRSGIKVKDLKIIETTSKIFGNPCEFQFGEICTKEYRPIQGWIVVVKVKEDSWTYHVNKSGSQILLDPKVITNELPKNLANAVLTDAANRSGLPIKSLKIAQSTKKTFGNACEFNFGEVCIQLFDPIEGWEVVVKVKGKLWTYHVNETGSSIVLDPKVNTRQN